MNYLYHSVPENLKGKYLMPLNELKKVYPKIYKEEVKKYEGRKILLKKRIPKLDCLWNDVLHFTAVHPSKLKKSLKEAGKKNFTSRKWFKINPKLIDLENAIVYLYPNLPLEKINLPKYYVPLKYNDLKNYDEFKKDTIKYFKEELNQGRNPLMFKFVPHILYKGKLKIKDLEIIEI